MGKFDYLNVPDQWNQYFTKYPQGYTILEALLNWVQQVDDMVDNVNDWNTYLDAFKAQFDTELQETVTTILTEWQDSGLLDIIINAALQTQLDDVEARTAKLENITGTNLDSFPRLTGETDDTAAIQRALDVIKNAGIGSLYVPDGKTYIISNRLYIPSNIRIYGKGVIKMKSGIAGFVMLSNNDQINGNSNILIEGITIDGNVQNAASKSDYDFGLDLRNVNGVRIREVTIKSTGGDGIYLGKGTANGCIDVVVERSAFDNNGRNGISVIYGNNITIRHNKFTNIVAPANPGAGIDVEPNTGDTLTSVLVEHNFAYNCQYGFNVWGVAAGVIMSDIVVRNNRANYCTEGYLISTLNDFILTGNKAWKCAKAGIDVSYLNNALIEGNTVIDCNTLNGGYNGILLYQYNTNCKIKNNNVYVTDTAQGQVTNIYEAGTGNANNLFEFNNCYPFRTSGMGLFGTGTIDTMNTRYDVIPTSSRMKMGNRNWTTGTAAPTTGTWSVGDICFNVAAAKGQPLGWYCVTGGTSGTWQAFGEVRTSGKSQAVMLASTTSIVVTHGLPNAPTNILLGAAGNLGAIWAESIDATQFTIKCSTAPNFNTAVWWRADS